MLQRVDPLTGECQQAVGRGQRLMLYISPLLKLRQGGLVPCDDGAQGLEYLLRREAVGLEQRLGLCQLLAALHPDRGLVHLDLLQHRIPLGLDFPHVVLDAILKLTIEVGVQDLPQDVLAVGGGGVEDPVKIPLGNHDHLLELLGVQPQRLGDGISGLLDAGDLPAVGQGQQNGSRHLPGSGAPALQHLLGGLAQNAPFLSLVQEVQLHLRLGLRRCILGAVLAAGGGLLVIEGVGDGVKDGALPGARVAADQVKPGAVQLPEVDLLYAGIGTKGLHPKINRLHTPSPLRSSISCCR